MAVDLNPSAGNTMHPMASYTYDAGGERIIKYHTEGFDVTSNAQEVSTPTETNAMRVMLYPSGLITAKVVKESETKMLTYTKHYYNGSQRISSKIGKAIEFGDVPVRAIFSDFGLPAPPTDLYTAENQTLNNATNTLKDIIIEFGVQQPEPNPDLLSNENGQKK